MSLVSIRPGTPADHPLLLDSFFRTYRETPHARGTPAKVLLEQMHHLLASPLWRLDVACATAEPTEILGMFLYRPGVPQRAAWCHVKAVWRGKGVARALLKNAGFRAGEIEVAFLDPECAKWVKAKGMTLRFRPLIPATVAYDNAKATVAA